MKSSRYAPLMAERESRLSAHGGREDFIFIPTTVPIIYSRGRSMEPYRMAVLPEKNIGICNNNAGSNLEQNGYSDI